MRQTKAVDRVVAVAAVRAAAEARALVAPALDFLPVAVAVAVDRVVVEAAEAVQEVRPVVVLLPKNPVLLLPRLAAPR